MNRLYEIDDYTIIVVSKTTIHCTGTVRKS